MSAHQIPLRDTAEGPRIETRPLYVEEWLDSLPYIDFNRTGQLLLEATQATNEQGIKPAVRLELAVLYGRPYQYYIDSQIKAGAQHTLQSIETMQEQIKVLKRIAVNLALACKISAEDSLKKKTLWGQSRPPLLNYLMSLNFLSHAMIFSYLEYAPTPKNVWKEINFIYDFAASLGQEHATLNLPESLARYGANTIAQAYKRITMASLSDPHHLPYGAIWEIYEQLGNWSALTEIRRFEAVENPASHFVIRLDSDASPLPYNKFNLASIGTQHRLLDATALGETVRRHIDTLEQGGRLDDSVIISPYYSRLLLDHLVRVWDLPPRRGNPRKEREGTLELACGLNPAFYFINGERDFVAPPGASDEDDETPVVPQTDPGYRLEEWNLVDQSARGFAVIKNIRPGYNIRVGDLITINTRNAQRRWAVGVIRWMMIRQGQIYKIGVQLLGTDITAIAVHASGGSAQDTRSRRALLITSGSTDKSESLITARGLYMPGRELELYVDGTWRLCKADRRLESTTGFEHFSLTARD